MITALPKDPAALLVLGQTDYTAKTKPVTVYTVQGSSVKINGTAVTKSSTIGSTDVFTANIPYTVAEKTPVVVEVTNANSTVTQTRSFVIANAGPTLYPVSIYYTEDSTQISRWTPFTSAGALAPAVTSSSDWKTQGDKSVKFVFTAPTRAPRWVKKYMLRRAWI
jgi:hypothetical protein